MSEPAAILLIGGSGQVGSELARFLPSLGDLTCLGQPALDLSRPDMIRAAVRSLSPTIVVNAAAYTAVDAAEREPELAYAVNARAPAVLAEECHRLGALLVHYSTDYVFDGTKAAAYVETDAPKPLNVYGDSKHEGEQAVRQSGCDHLLLRTSWVYGTRGRNFLLTMLKLGRERDRLSIVDDQTGAPTWARALADVTVGMVGRWQQAMTAERTLLSGTYHTTALGQTTWFGFAKAIFEQSESMGFGKIPQLEPVPTSSFPTPARRPSNSILDNAKLRDTFGFSLAPWEEAMIACLHELVTAPPAAPVI